MRYGNMRRSRIIGRPVPSVPGALLLGLGYPGFRGGGVRRSLAGGLLVAAFRRWTGRRVRWRRFALLPFPEHMGRALGRRAEENPP